MNIFLISSDHKLSARTFYSKDPLRARKQLLECCQMLASFEILKTGKTGMIKADGNCYRAAHTMHPIVQHMCHHKSGYDLCWNVAKSLAELMPDHACSNSLSNYTNHRHLATSDNQEYRVCRRFHVATYAKTLDEYANLMLSYLQQYKWKR